VKGHEEVGAYSGHPHLVYRRLAVQHHRRYQQQQQQSTDSSDHALMCGLENEGKTLNFNIQLHKINLRMN